MNFEDITWDIRHILGALKPGNRVLTAFLMNKVNNYRAIRIIEKFGFTGVVDAAWIQNTGKLITTMVNSADDPNVASTSVAYSKCTLPAIVSLPDSAGEFRLMGSSAQARIYKTTADNLYLKISGKSDDLKMYHYYFRIENSIYIYPTLDEISCYLVQEDPMETAQYQTEYVLSGNIKPDVQYIVDNGTIVYQGTTYVKGQTFNGTIVGENTFSGNGKVKYVNQKIDKKLIHNYPITRDLAQMCIIDILTKEYQIEMNLIQDVINDQQDQLKIVKSAQNERR